MPAGRTIFAALAALFALAWFAWAAAPSVEIARQGHISSARDLLPLYLGAQALAAGRDPNDPEALRAVYQGMELKMQVGGFISHYPRSAALLARPMVGVPVRDVVKPFRWLLLFSMVGAAVAGVLAGASGGAQGARAEDRRGRVLLLVALVAATAAFALSLRVSAAIVRLGQPGPIIALLTGLALWALARRRDVGAGLAIAIGASIKLFPALLLVPALGARRWRVVGAAVAVIGGLLLAAYASAPVTGGRDQPLFHFLFPEPTPAWENWLLPVWRVRSGILPLTAIALGWAAWRGASAASAGAVVLAAGGVLLAGTHHPHESIQMVPVLAWIVGGIARPGARRWEVVVPIAVCGIGVAAGVTSAAGHAPTLSFLPLALAAWAACLYRMVSDVRAGASAASVTQAG